MLRKLILLAVVTSLAKAAYGQRRANRLRTPFPTTRRPPEGYRNG